MPSWKINGNIKFIGIFHDTFKDLLFRVSWIFFFAFSKAKAQSKKAFSRKRRVKEKEWETGKQWEEAGSEVGNGQWQDEWKNREVKSRGGREKSVERVDERAMGWRVKIRKKEGKGAERMWKRGRLGENRKMKMERKKRVRMKKLMAKLKNSPRKNCLKQISTSEKLSQVNESSMQ